MTTIYKEFENNSEVMDVLFCIIDGKDNVKNMVKILKQPQSTISTKLQFLRDNDVVVKTKWKYEVNWNKLSNIFLKRFENQMEVWVKSKKNLTKFLGIFDKNRIENIIKTYARVYTVKDDVEVVININHIILDYLFGMTQVDDKKLEKVDKRLVELKKYFKMESFEKFFFEECEDIGEVIK